MAPKLCPEALESRLAPVLGATNIPAPVEPPGLYDGVIKIVQPEGYGTGSPLKSGYGHFVLTATYVVVDKEDTQVKFELARDGVVVPITLTVPKAGINRNTNYKQIDGVGVNDIALLRLWDGLQGVPPKCLVAPYKAQQYYLHIYTNEASKPVNFAGYGFTGVGATGQVAGSGGTKRAGVNQIDATGAFVSNFTYYLELTGKGKIQFKYKGKLSNLIDLKDLIREKLLTKLEAVQGLNGSVAVTELNATKGIYLITFKGDLANVTTELKDFELVQTGDVAGTAGPVYKGGN